MQSEIYSVVLCVQSWESTLSMVSYGFFQNFRSLVCFHRKGGLGLSYCPLNGEWIWLRACFLHYLLHLGSVANLVYDGKGAKHKHLVVKLSYTIWKSICDRSWAILMRHLLQVAEVRKETAACAKEHNVHLGNLPPIGKDLVCQEVKKSLPRLCILKRLGINHHALLITANQYYFCLLHLTSIVIFHIRRSTRTRCCDHYG